MKLDAQMTAIATLRGWEQVSGTEAMLDGTTIWDRRFGGYKRKVVRWNHSRAFRGWIKTPGFHQIDIYESNAVPTDELIRDYEIQAAWRGPNGCFYRNIPGSPTDLNAMYEAEKVLITDALCDEYNSRLESMVGGANPNGWKWHATATQRREALLRTLGKWEDDR